MTDDLISRAALLAAYDAAHKGPPGGARKLIAEAPAVDAVPVVRCKDCKHWDRDWTPWGTHGERHWCEPYDGFPDADFFCADAERADAPTCGPDYCEIGGDGNAKNLL